MLEGEGGTCMHMCIRVCACDVCVVSWCVCVGRGHMGVCNHIVSGGV